MKKVISILLLSCSCVFGQGARTQPGGMLTPVPVYNVSQVASNVVEIIGTNFGIGYQLETSDTNLVISTNLILHIYTAHINTNSYDLKGAANAVSNNLANIFNFGASGFVTLITNGSSTATIQDVFNNATNRGLISAQPGDYHITASIKITNEMYISAYGAHFIYDIGLTNYMFDMGTNNGKPFVMIGSTLDGQTYINYNNTNYHHIQSGQSSDPYYNNFWTNRTGIRLEGSGGAIFRDNTLVGWSGQGVLAIEKGGAFNAQTMPKIRIEDNNCYSNFLAINITGGNQNYLGYNHADISTWNLLDTAEYALVTHNNCYKNYCGVAAGAGNVKVWENQLPDNFISIGLWGGVNGTHGSYSINDCNHSTYGAIVEGSTGALMQGNVFLACGNFLAENVHGIDFVNNKIASMSLTFTNDCTGNVVNNYYDFAGTWGGTTVTNFAGSPALIFYGNRSDDGTNTDGRMTADLTGSTVNSNKVFYWVTTTKTNLVSNGQ